MKIVAKIVGIAALALPLWGMAHQDGADGDAENYFMDCEHPPADALRSLPEPLSGWGRIMCLHNGQSLVQSKDTQWRYPGSWTEKVYIPARIDADELDGRPRYFTRMSVREMPADEGRSQHQRLLKQVAVYADRIADPKTNALPEAPKRSWEIIATNNASKTFQIFLMQIDGREDMWGMACVPACESQMAFIVTPLN